MGSDYRQNIEVIFFLKKTKPQPSEIAPKKYDLSALLFLNGTYQFALDALSERALVHVSVPQSTTKLLITSHLPLSITLQRGKLFQ